jgi:ribosomal protein S13
VVAAVLTLGVAFVLYRSFRKQRGIRAQPQFTRQNLRERDESEGASGALGFGDVAVSDDDE